MKKKSFVMYEDWANYILNLPVEMAGELSQMIMSYALCGKIDEEKEYNNPALDAMFTIIKKKMDEDAKKYQDKCDKLKDNLNSKSDTNGTQMETKRETNDDDMDYVASSTSTSSSTSTKEQVVEVIDYLNKVCDKNYKAKSKSSVDYISGRLNDGYTVNDLKRVIDIKASKWKGDPKMDDYLRPTTLFAPKKFEAYLNERPRGDPKTRSEQIEEQMKDW